MPAQSAMSHRIMLLLCLGILHACVQAGILAPACAAAAPLCITTYYGCIAACTVTVPFVGPTVIVGCPAACGAAAAACVAGIAACSGTCFSEHTLLVRRTPAGTATHVSILNVTAGDELLTLTSSATPTWTTLRSVTRVEADSPSDSFPFTSLRTDAGTVTVTLDHGVVVSSSAGQLSVVDARHVAVGDVVFDAEGAATAVLSTHASRAPVKLTLITDAASVVATEAGGGSRGIVVSTMCGSGSATPVPFDDAVTAWRALHAHLLA